MKIGKIKPVATIVAQFAAGVEIDAIQHDGKMFLPVLGLGELNTSSDEPAPEEKPQKSSKTTESKEETTSYSKDDLMDMDVKELTKILKDVYGINPNDYDGKNTNKKLRDLILDAQENGKSDDDEEDEEGSGDSPESDVEDQVSALLEDFDSGKRNKKKTISEILSLGDDDVDSDAISELVDEFESDGDADLDEIAGKIAGVLSGKKSKKTSKKENLIEIDDLEKGNRVSVWWNDKNKAWYDGEVTSVKKGKVTVSYDDGTDSVLDPDVHTKIKLLD